MFRLFSIFISISVLIFGSFSYGNPYTKGFYDVPSVVEKSNDDLCKYEIQKDICFEKMSVWVAFYHVSKNKDHYNSMVSEMLKKYPEKSRVEIETVIVREVSEKWKREGRLPFSGTSQ